MAQLRPVRRAVVAMLVVGALVASCRSGPDRSADVGGSTAPTATPPPATKERTASALCSARLAPGGSVAASDLVETSGLVASRAHAGVLWGHNDSGGAPEIFALGLDGSDRGRVEVAGAGAVDWEDVAMVAGDAGVPDRLLIGDIGDNPGGGSRTSSPVRLHRVDEPVPPGAGATASTGPAVAIDLAYADGPRDAEALLADPLTGDAFVVSKQWDGTAAGVYRIPASAVAAPAGPGSTVVMDRMADVATTAGALVAGGDIAADGTAVVLRTYAAVVVWDRDPARSVAETLTGAPLCSVPVLELQGESVAVLADGSGMVTVPEGAGAAVQVRRGS